MKSNCRFWDIAGQKRFIGLTNTYYRGASATIVVVDITVSGSLESALSWKRDVDSKVFLPNGDNVPTILLANKFDLLQENPSLRQYQDTDLNEFCHENGFLGWFSASAKTGYNIRKAMHYIIGETVAVVLNPHGGNRMNQGIDIREKSGGNRGGKCSRCATASHAGSG